MVRFCLSYAIFPVFALALSAAFAESRGKPFSEEQLLQQSAVVFVGEVLDTKTYEDYKRTMPSQARVLLSIKGEVGRGEYRVQPKDPGLFAYFDEEFTVAKKKEIGIFYVGTRDNPHLLLGYRVIQP